MNNNNYSCLAKCALFLAGWFLLTGCGERPGKKAAAEPVTPEKTISSKPPSSYDDTLVIAPPAVVIFSPDSLQLEKIRALTEPGTYESSMHEYEYMIRYARHTLRQYWPQLPVIDARKVRYLLFTQPDTATACIDLDRNNDAYGIYFTRQHAPPRVADMANIDRELPAYFSQQ